MTNMVYPQEKAIESIKGGIATVRQGAMRIESAVVAGEDIRAQFGGMGEARYEESNLRALWTPAERKTFRDFVRLFRKWLNARIPEVRKELKEQMKQDRFMGARNPRELENKLNNHMKQDSRLYIQTKTGTVFNSVSEQKEWAHRDDKEVKPPAETPEICRHCLKPMTEEPASFCGSETHSSLRSAALLGARKS